MYIYVMSNNFKRHNTINFLFEKCDYKVNFCYETLDGQRFGRFKWKLIQNQCIRS